VQIPKFDTKPNPSPNFNSYPDPNPMPIRFGQMTLRTSELSPLFSPSSHELINNGSLQIVHKQTQHACARL